MNFIDTICSKYKKRKKSVCVNKRALRYERLETRELLAITGFDLFQQVSDTERVVLEVGDDDSRIATVSAKDLFEWGILISTDTETVPSVGTAEFRVSYDESVLVCSQRAKSDLKNFAKPVGGDDSTQPNSSIKEDVYSWMPLEVGEWYNQKEQCILKDFIFCSAKAEITEPITTNITITGFIGKGEDVSRTMALTINPVGQSDISVAFPQGGDSKSLTVSQTGTAAELGTFAVTNSTNYLLDFTATKAGSGNYKSFFTVDKATSKLKLSGTAGNLEAGTYNITVTGTDATTSKTSSDVYTLTVNADPVAKSITLDPTSKTLLVSQTGVNTELATVTATNIASTATFQCFVNGSTTASSDFVVNTGKLYTTKTLAAGSYSIVVKADNTASSAFALTVNADPVAKSITLNPTSKTLLVSQTGVNTELATVTATNIASTATFQCFVNGSTTASSDFVVNTGKLYTTKALAAGSYSIVVKADNTASSAFALTVNADPVVKSITLNPTSKTLIVSQTGVNTELATVTATNIASSATFQCFVNGSTTASSDFVVNTGKLYTTKALTAGYYSIVVKADNTASSAFALTVNADPVVKSITLNPTSKTLLASQTGANVELAAVTVTGIESTATFQCFVDGSTTASSDFSVSYGKLYTTKKLAAASYSIVVKADNTSSAPFALTVTADPTTKNITLNPTSTTIESTYTGKVADITLEEFVGNITWTITEGNNDVSTMFSTENGVFSYLGGLTAKGQHVITVAATDAEGGWDETQFSLNILDSVIDVSTLNYAEYKLDVVNGKYILTGDNNEIANADIDGGILSIIGAEDNQETLTITSAAAQALKQIYFNGSDGNATTCRDLVVIDGPETGAAVYTIDSVAPMAGIFTDAPVGDAIYGGGTVAIQGGAQVAFMGAKNLIFQSNGADTFNVKQLDANVNIKTPENNNAGVLDFSGITLGSAGNTGVVLNMGSQWHQAAVVGQVGTLRLTGNLAKVILSAGNDTITGSPNGTIIEDATASNNLVTLKGGDNEVTLGGSSTVVATAAESNNTIKVTGDYSVINLGASTGTNVVEATGNNIVLTGSVGNDTVTVIGNNDIVNLGQGGNDVVNLTGDKASITTGAGNDTINFSGSNGIISTGAGNDEINITDGANGAVSTGNMINAGDGNDLILALTCTGNNIYYGGNGNDMIFGGLGKDTIYGNAGNNILVGSRGQDTITGGTGKNILIGNVSSGLADKSEAQLRQLFTDLQGTWLNDDPDWEATIALLGEESVSDSAQDVLKRGNSELAIFFADELDTTDALDSDMLFI